MLIKFTEILNIAENTSHYENGIKYKIMDLTSLYILTQSLN